MEVGIMEVGIMEVGIMEVGIMEVDILEVDIMEVNVLKANIMEINILEVSIMEINILDVNILAVDTQEVGVLEVNILEVDVARKRPNFAFDKTILSDRSQSIIEQKIVFFYFLYCGRQVRVPAARITPRRPYRFHRFRSHLNCSAKCRDPLLISPSGPVDDVWPPGAKVGSGGGVCAGYVPQWRGLAPSGGVWPPETEMAPWGPPSSSVRLSFLIMTRVLIRRGKLSPLGVTCWRYYVTEVICTQVQKCKKIAGNCDYEIQNGKSVKKSPEIQNSKWQKLLETHLSTD
jgi:hypothetical protein